MDPGASAASDRLKVILSHLPRKSKSIPFDFLVSFTRQFMRWHFFFPFATNNIYLFLCVKQGSQKSFEISTPPKGLESAVALLFTEDCLDFLVKLVESFDHKVDEVRFFGQSLFGK